MLKKELQNKAEELGVNVDVSKYENILNIYYKTADKVDAFIR